MLSAQFEHFSCAEHPMQKKKEECRTHDVYARRAVVSRRYPQGRERGSRASCLDRSVSTKQNESLMKVIFMMFQHFARSLSSRLRLVQNNFAT